MPTRTHTGRGIGPDEPRDADASEDRTRPSRDLGEALLRARRHGRAAAAEILAMLGALLEAAALASSARSSEGSRLFGPLLRLLEDLGNELAIASGRSTSRALAAVAAALDDEIARWEKRAHDDIDARRVLRIFLSLREVLWEFGVRSGSPDRAGAPAPRKNNPDRTCASGGSRSRAEGEG